MGNKRTPIYYFYVLLCHDQTLYGGYTTDLLHRFEVHQAGKGAKYTRVKKRHPLQLIYAEQWSSKSLAMAAEYRFKRLSRQQKDLYLQRQGLAKCKTNQCWLVDHRKLDKDGLEQLFSMKEG